jgi:hypothetical protein
MIRPLVNCISTFAALYCAIGCIVTDRLWLGFVKLIPLGLVLKLMGEAVLNCICWSKMFFLGNNIIFFPCLTVKMGST